MARRDLRQISYHPDPQGDTKIVTLCESLVRNVDTASSPTLLWHVVSTQRMLASLAGAGHPVSPLPSLPRSQVSGSSRGASWGECGWEKESWEIVGRREGPGETVWVGEEVLGRLCGWERGS